MNVAAEGIDIERGKENLQRMGIGTSDPTFAGKPISQVNAETAAAMGIKKKRSDAGTKRPAKPEPAKAGVLSAEQVAKLKMLISELADKRDEEEGARKAHAAAMTAVENYFAELQGKQ